MREKNKEPRAATAIAGIYSNLGEIDNALEWLERAYEERSGYLISILNDFTFQNLHSEPRFQALLEKIRIGKESERKLVWSVVELRYLSYLPDFNFPVKPIGNRRIECSSAKKER